MLVEVKSVAIADPESWGIGVVGASSLFNFDAFSIPLNDEEQAFISSINNEWKIIPEKLLDFTTAENFYMYVRLPLSN